MSWIEVRRRLVEDQELRFLSQRRGDVDRLSLAARKTVQRSVCESRKAGEIKGSPHGPVVVFRQRHLKTAEMRMTP
jgi:hypothetical protein